MQSAAKGMKRMKPVAWSFFLLRIVSLDNQRISKIMNLLIMLFKCAETHFIHECQWPDVQFSIFYKLINIESGTVVELSYFQF